MVLRSYCVIMFDIAIHFSFLCMNQVFNKSLFFLTTYLDDASLSYNYECIHRNLCDCIINLRNTVYVLPMLF